MIIKAIFLFIVLIKNRKEYIVLKSLICYYNPEVVSFDKTFKVKKCKLLKVNTFQDNVDDVDLIENVEDLTVSGKSVLFIRLEK